MGNASGVVYSMNTRSITCMFSDLEQDLSKSVDYMLELLPHKYTLSKMLDALKEMDSVKLAPVLYKEREPSEIPAIVENTKTYFSREALNESQRHAVEACMASSGVHVIHGPPGKILV